MDLAADSASTEAESILILVVLAVFLIRPPKPALLQRIRLEIESESFTFSLDSWTEAACKRYTR
jgi:hypothetical protein